MACALLCGVAFAQAPPHTPVPAEVPTDEDGPAEFEDAGAYTWNVVPLPDASANVVAGRGVQIPASEVVARLRDANGALQDGYATNPALVEELVDRMTADRLLANEARRRGLESDPIVRAAIERVLVARLRALVINPEVDAARVTDEEVAAWYAAHPERFHFPERRRVRVAFLRARRDAAEVLRLATARRRGEHVHEFRRLAAEHNDDPHLRSMAGDLRDVTPTPVPGGLELDPALRRAIFEVPAEGDTLARAVEGRWRGTPGFFVVHLVSVRRPEERSLAAQSDWIRLRLALERRVIAERERVAALQGEARLTRVPMQRVVRFEAVPVSADAGVCVAPDAPPR